MHKILILTSDMGLGHRSASNAIEAALREQYADQVRITHLNPMEHPKVPTFYRDNPDAYDTIVKHMPEFYNFTYKAVDHKLTSPLVENLNTTMLLEAFFDILNDIHPDVIVVTRENYLSTLWALNKFSRRRIPVITVVTDLGSVHRLWFNSVSAMTCVPNQRVYDLALSFKMAPEALLITGIPVQPRLALETRPPAEIRAELGWQPDLRAVLVVGSPRVKNMRDTLRVLNHCNQPIQLVVVAGGDNALFAELQAMEWHVTVHLYNFVTNMPQLLRAADVLACKAGGLMITEGLACGLPILIIDAIEGQETGNVEYVVDYGAGEYPSNPLEMLETLYDWLSDDAALLAITAERARKIGFPRSAIHIADLVYAYAIGTRTVPVKEKSERLLPSGDELRTWVTRLLNDGEL